jgi:hypothetical protein
MRKVYKDNEEAIADIPRIKKEVLPCLEMVTNEIFDFPLYLPTSSYITDTPPVLGTIKVNFKLSEIKPMISVGEWVLYYFYDAEIIEVVFKNTGTTNKDTIEELFFTFAGVKDKKIEVGNVRFSHFYRVMEDELKFFQRICDINGALTIGRIIWNA